VQILPIQPVMRHQKLKLWFAEKRASQNLFMICFSRRVCQSTARLGWRFIIAFWKHGDLISTIFPVHYKAILHLDTKMPFFKFSCSYGAIAWCEVKHKHTLLCSKLTGWPVLHTAVQKAPMNASFLQCHINILSSVFVCKPYAFAFC